MTTASRNDRRWKRPLLTGVVTTLAWVATPTDAEAANPNVRFGLGGSLGDPLGGSMKLFVHPQHALQFEFGWAPMHHGDGITHINYLFHFKPFVQHDVLDFGMYLGGGIGVAFWRARYYDPRNCYDPPGPDDWRCDGYYDYAYGGHYGYYGYPYYRRRGGAGMIIRPPVLGLFVHFQDVPIDVGMEGAWSPYVVIAGGGWDPFHGDFSIKCRYYF
jgi:hypothetical protein